MEVLDGYLAGWSILENNLNSQTDLACRQHWLATYTEDRRCLESRNSTVRNRCSLETFRKDGSRKPDNRFERRPELQPRCPKNFPFRRWFDVLETYTMSKTKQEYTKLISQA